MGYLDLEGLKNQLSKLSGHGFSSLFQDLRACGAEAFNDAFIAPERLDSDDLQTFRAVFAEHGVSLELERSHVRDVFLLVMTEAIYRGVRRS